MTHLLSFHRYYTLPSTFPEREREREGPLLLRASIHVRFQTQAGRQAERLHPTPLCDVNTHTHTHTQFITEPRKWFSISPYVELEIVCNQVKMLLEKLLSSGNKDIMHMQCQHGPNVRIRILYFCGKTILCLYKIPYLLTIKYYIIIE